MDAPIRLSVNVTTGDVELVRAVYSSRLSSVKGLPHNRLHNCKRVFYPMIQLIDEHVVARLRALVLGKVHE